MRTIDIFKELTKIPRCSGTHEPFISYIQKFAKENGCICKIDNAKNILLYKTNGNPTLCLQSHYDIVCLEDGKIPEIIQIDGYLKAKDSTLGADNGIGCAYMLALIEDGKDVECLFTCDEEIGLIGANGIEHKLKSSYMLNLDSEEEGSICIGCAGGIDIFAINTNYKIVSNDKNKELYEININHLDGGHSGVDIDKNIPNALKLIAQTIKECDADLLDLNGGERINSIAKSAKAIVVSNTLPNPTHQNMKIEKLDTQTNHYKKLDDNIINFLYTFANGVRGYDKELGVVLSSINLAIVSTNLDGVKIELSARSMDNAELALVKKETISLLECFGFEVTTSGKYPAWKPMHSDFTAKVLEIYKKHNKEATMDAIHAGLECAIFKEKYPNIQIVSIGPNIYFPHSHREECEISSIHNVYKVLEDIVNYF
jgi:dipeptidase D